MLRNLIVGYLPNFQDSLTVPFSPLNAPHWVKVPIECAEIIETINTAEYYRRGIPQPFGPSVEETSL
jgi:hypothetical protein